MSWQKQPSNGKTIPKYCHQPIHWINFPFSNIFREILEMSYGYFDTSEGEGKIRYVEKRKNVKLGECPYRLADDFWVDNIMTMYNIEYPGVYE